MSAMHESSVHPCRQCTLLVAAGEVPATCGDCGAELRRQGRTKVAPRAQRDIAALAALTPLRAIDLDPRSRLCASDGGLEGELRAARTREHARIARARLRAMIARGAEGERFVRALWLAYGARGPIANARESLALLVATECLRFDQADWSTFVAERARVVARAAERKEQVPNVVRVVGTILGNAILGAAVAAYEHDTWETWRPRAAEPETPARVQRLLEWRARFDARLDDSTRT